MKKLLTWIVVMAMCVLPVGALAEGAALGTLSVGNFSFALNDEAEKTIGITFNFSAGGEEDGRGLLGLSADAGDAEILSLELMTDAQALTGYLNGMSSAYTITMEEVQQLAQQSMNVTTTAPVTPEMPQNIDSQALKDMMEGYIGFLMDMSDPEKVKLMDDKTTDDKIMAALGVDPDAQPVTEEVSVLGQTMTLPRYDMSLTLADFDALYQVLCEANENFDKFWTNYMKFFASSLGMDADQATFAGIMQSAGAEMTMDLTMWVDDAKEWVRAEMQMHVTAQEDGQTVDITIPYALEAHESADGIEMTLSMDMDDAGVAMKMDMNAAKTADGGTLSYDMSVKADSEDALTMNLDGSLGKAEDGVKALNCTLSVTTAGEDAVTIKLDGACGEAEDGTEAISGTLSITVAGQEVIISLDGTSKEGDGAEAINGTFAVSIGGQQLGSLTLDYAGTVTIDGEFFERKGRVNLTGDAMGEKASFGFDVGVKLEPLTEDAFARIASQPLVKYSELDDDKIQQASIEAQTALLSALGGLMQAPGVAELVSEMMTTTEYPADQGYGDYGADYGSEYGYGMDEADQSADGVKA